MANRQVQILMGSDSDASVMQRSVDVLTELGVTSHMTVASAHRTPERVRRVLDEALNRGTKVFIVGAGAAAHLGGVAARRRPGRGVHAERAHAGLHRAVHPGPERGDAGRGRGNARAERERRHPRRRLRRRR